MHIHIIGIAGVKTAPLAKILVDQGNKVTGSDQKKIFPPVSTILEKAGIKINDTPITKSIDLVIVGNVYQYFENTTAEFDQVLQLGIPYISYTDYLVQHLIKENSILVAGSYGKTTITSLLSYIFLQLKLDPTFMFGGEPIDEFFPTGIGKSEWSIIEADENHNGLDTMTTFLSYPVKYLILSSAKWEHKDSYPVEADNLNAYLQLVKKVPANGLIIYNGQDADIQKIIGFSQAKTIDYQTDKIFETKLVGAFNQQNIAAVVKLCQELKLDDTQVLTAIKNFSGIKRRLELKYTNNNILVYDDFAQSATRVKSAIEAINYTYPGRRIRIFYEPRASFLQNKNSLLDFDQISELCHDFILGKIQYSKSVDKSLRTTASLWMEKVGPKLKYLPIEEDLYHYITSTLLPGDILVHFSSGGLEGQNIVDRLVTHIDHK